MTIAAVIAYLEREERPPHGGAGRADLAAVAARAAAMGFAFDVDELRVTLQVRDLLARVKADAALRRELLAAPSKLKALAAIAQRAGHGFDAAAIAQVLRAARARTAELEGTELEQVVGGGGRGYVLPEVDDEVLVGFVQGDIRSPLVIGSLWNDKDKPPT